MSACPNNQKCAIDAQVSGRVLIGLGCWCNDGAKDGAGVPLACTAIPSTRRHLQENQLYVVQITEEPFPLAAAEEETEPVCTGFFLFCWIQSFLNWLISVLSFGLL